MLSEMIAAPVEPEMRTFLSDLAYQQRVPVAKIVRSLLEYAADEYRKDPKIVALPSGWAAHKSAPKE